MATNVLGDVGTVRLKPGATLVFSESRLTVKARECLRRHLPVLSSNPGLGQQLATYPLDLVAVMYDARGNRLISRPFFTCDHYVHNDTGMEVIVRIELNGRILIEDLERLQVICEVAYLIRMPNGFQILAHDTTCWKRCLGAPKSDLPMPGNRSQMRERSIKTT